MVTDAAARGEAAALGPRRPLETKLRRWFHAGFRRLAKPEARGRIDALYFVPGVRDAAELADLAARINWYLADVDVPIHVAGADGVAFSPLDAPHMDPSLVHRDRIVAGAPRAGVRARLVLHRVDVASVAQTLPRARRMSIADPLFAYTSELGYYRLRHALSATEAPEPGVALRNLLAQRVEGGRALVLGTGPSATELDPTSVTAEIRVLCNSAVRDLKLVTTLRPQAICFGDPVFHFGPSTYAAAFRADLRRAIEVCDAAIVLPIRYASLFTAHLPDLADRVVAVDDGAAEWRWITEDRPEVHMSGNVLTYLMLPVALALADHVDIGGCDGRVATERYFWKHNPAIQYGGDLMADAFATHPAFFRSRDYGGYYDEHVAHLEEFLAVAEAAGKTVRGVTRSHIPALVARGAPRFT